MITLLTGPNTYTIAEAIRERTRLFSGQAETYDASELEPRHLPDLFTGVSLFAPERLIVLRGVASNRTLWTELEQWIEKVPAETEMIVVESNPDKRTKTYKQLQKHGTIKEHKELDVSALKTWLQNHARKHQIELAPDVASYFINYVGHDQWRLGSELQKLLLADKPITHELIQDVVEPYPEATAFELLDAVFKRDARRVEELIGLLRVREDPYQFFGLLSSQVFAVLAIGAADSRRPADVASDMSLHPFVVSKLTPVAREFGGSRVGRLIESLAHCDVRIKTSGVDPWHQLQLTLLSMCTTR